jgi:hypothetical protein
MDKHHPEQNDVTPASDQAEGGAHTPESETTGDEAVRPNPPRTTSGGITAPKFGSAGSGGAELDPGPERD